MMPSKFTWILFFVALCFRISEIADALNIIECYTDGKCAKEFPNYAFTYVPVLITKDVLISESKVVTDYLRAKGYLTVIKVYVQNGICPLTHSVFPTGNRYPALFMVIKDRRYVNVCYPSGDTANATMNTFLTQATQQNALTFKEEVTSTIQQGLALNVVQQLQSVAYAVVKQFPGGYAELDAPWLKRAVSEAASQYAVGLPRGYKGSYSVSAAMQGYPMQQAGPSGTRHSSSPPMSGARGSPSSSSFAANEADVGNNKRKEPDWNLEPTPSHSPQSSPPSSPRSTTQSSKRPARPRG